MNYCRLVLASLKRRDEILRTAIEHYYGSHADMGRIRCMVTGEEADVSQITAGHIYRQDWPAGILVSILTPTSSIAFHRIELCTKQASYSNISIRSVQASLTCASAKAMYNSIVSTHLC